MPKTTLVSRANLHTCRREQDDRGCRDARRFLDKSATSNRGQSFRPSMQVMQLLERSIWARYGEAKVDGSTEYTLLCAAANNCRCFMPLTPAYSMPSSSSKCFDQTVCTGWLSNERNKAKPRAGIMKIRWGSVFAP